VLSFSSQFSTMGWSAQQVLGQPNTFAYGDFASAWAPSTADTGIEHVMVGYDAPVFADSATIRETLGNGFVVQVRALDLDGMLHTVWSGSDPSQPGSVVEFLVQWPTLDFPVDGLLVVIDTSLDDFSFEEIDAIALHGTQGIGDIEGDVNFDDVVDIFDIGLVSEHWLQSGPPGILGDANVDGAVDIFDIGTISENWDPLGGGPAQVPEPSTLTLSALGFALAAAALRSRASTRRTAARTRDPLRAG
jgi:hypothetical protein